MPKHQHQVNTANAQAKLLDKYGALPVTGYIRLPTMRQITGVSDSTIWRWSRTGRLPAPVKLSEKITAWRAEAIRQWLDAQGQEAA